MTIRYLEVGIELEKMLTRYFEVVEPGSIIFGERSEPVLKLGVRACKNQYRNTKSEHIHILVGYPVDGGTTRCSPGGAP